MGKMGGTANRRIPIGDDIHTITDLAQVRVLADPFRLKLLGAFGDRPRTTKQVAQRLGEKPTRLYHHVEALERVGLLILKETRPNRGTLEKYFQAVATRFQIGPALSFTCEPGGPAIDAAASMLMSILDTTRAELAGALNARRPQGCVADPAVVARMLVHGEPGRITEFRSRLLALLDEFKAECGAEDSDKPASYGLTLAFYPLPRSMPNDDGSSDSTTP
jgi:hypothetical protein